MVHKFFGRAKPYIEIIKLKSSLVDVSIALAICSFFEVFGYKTLLAIISAVFIHGAADIYNDIYDREIDKICKPNSPLVSGRMSLKSAWIYMILLVVSGLSISLLLSEVLFLCYIFGIVFGYMLYSHPKFRFKDKPVISIATIALCFSAEAVGIWSIYSKLSYETLIFALYIFILVFSLAFMKDFKDVLGDVSSLPIILGIRKSARICSILAMVPLFSFMFLYLTYKMKEIMIVASVYIISVIPAIKILLFEDPVSQGRKLRNFMIVAIVSPNITLFLLNTTSMF